MFDGEVIENYDFRQVEHLDRQFTGSVGVADDDDNQLWLCRGDGVDH